jgi:acyl-CoA synthetase (AMP-forming)/AMP-acid ligase II
MKTDISGWQIRHDEELAAGYRRTGAWKDQTVSTLAEALAHNDPERVTHVFEGVRYPILRMFEDAQALAAALQARGFTAGEVIAFQLPNWAEAMVIDLAASLLGLVVAPIVPIYREAEAAYMLADCGAKAAFVPGEYRGYDYLAMMRRLAPHLPSMRLISSVRVVGGDGDSYEAMVGARGMLEQRPQVDPGAVKMILYTSGTTGRPKGVLHSHNTMAYTVQRAMLHWGLVPGDTMLMASPVTHITGFGSGLELPLLCGIRTVFMERWNAAEGLDLIEREGVSISMGATPFLQELVAEAESRGRRLPSLRIYVCGGAAVPPALIRKARIVFQNCMPFRVFGSSEVPLTTLGYVDPGQLDLAAETDGAVVHYDVRVTDDEGGVLPVGEEGEIRARGPAMFLGYAEPAQTRDSFDTAGYFKTGDLGVITHFNAIVITGRKKDLINRGGEKISAKEVEDVLHTHPAIEEAAVVAVPHARLGETVGAFVILKKGQSLDVEQISQHMVAAGVARQKCPERLIFVEEFLRTASGKIRKDLLRADARARG